MPPTPPDNASKQDTLSAASDAWIRDGKHPLSDKLRKEGDHSVTTAQEFLMDSIFKPVAMSNKAGTWVSEGRRHGFTTDGIFYVLTLTHSLTAATAASIVQDTDPATSTGITISLTLPANPHQDIASILPWLCRNSSLRVIPTGSHGALRGRCDLVCKVSEMTRADLTGVTQINGNHWSVLTVQLGAMLPQSATFLSRVALSGGAKRRSRLERLDFTFGNGSRNPLPSTPAYLFNTKGQSDKQMPPWDSLCLEDGQDDWIAEVSDTLGYYKWSEDEAAETLSINHLTGGVDLNEDPSGVTVQVRRSLMGFEGGIGVDKCPRECRITTQNGQVFDFTKEISFQSLPIESDEPSQPSPHRICDGSTISFEKNGTDDDGGISSAMKKLVLGQGCIQKQGRRFYERSIDYYGSFVHLTVEGVPHPGDLQEYADKMFEEQKYCTTFSCRWDKEKSSALADETLPVETEDHSAMPALAPSLIPQQSDHSHGDWPITTTSSLHDEPVTHLDDSRTP